MLLTMTTNRRSHSVAPEDNVVIGFTAIYQSIEMSQPQIVQDWRNRARMCLSMASKASIGLAHGGKVPSRGLSIGGGTTEISQLQVEVPVKKLFARM